MIRKMDSSGRIVIPMEVRNKLNWKIEKDYSIEVIDNKLCIKPVGDLCSICGKNIIVFSLEDGKGLCKDCLEKIKNK